jgi:hypothetical protein
MPFPAIPCKTGRYPGHSRNRHVTPAIPRHTCHSCHDRPFFVKTPSLPYAVMFSVYNSYEPL